MSYYRGDITVLLSNTTNAPFHLPANSKIAQLLFIPSALPSIIETTEPLTSTNRNTNGFGSTNTMPSETFNITPSVPCNRIHRPLMSLPTIQEEIPDISTNDTEVTEDNHSPMKPSKTPSKAPQNA
jgi:hypothetical protein